MANRAERTFPRADSSFRVGDCYIWSEINYLDSATDYRECLAEQSPKPACGNNVEDFVMLDSGAVCWGGVFAVLVVMMAGIAGLGWLVYLAASGL